MNDARLAQIEAHIAEIRARHSVRVEEVYWLVGWCEEMAADLHRWRPVQTSWPTESVTVGGR